MRSSLLSLLALSASVQAWLPAERDMFGEQRNSVARNIPAGKGRSVKRFDSGYNKIRGVSLGSLFIIEPWMAGQAWNSMGCGGAKSEFDCMIKLGQDAGDAAFAKHWDSWIVEEDFDKMKQYGINTVRIPVGYWMVEDIVYRDSEHFPKGGLAKLDRVAGWAAARNIYVILDLHGAPGAQYPENPYTGQYAPSSGFFQTYQYERAYTFLETMTERIHTNSAYATTGMIEVLNEPERKIYPSLVSEYYTNAYKKIRAKESSLNVPQDKQLTVQFMDKSWGSGNPKDAVQGQSGVAYDDHRYLKWANIENTKENYIKTSCADTFGAGDNRPVIIGEWSIAVPDDLEQTPEWAPTNDANKAFYTQWWAAQVSAYEKELGWVFWAWKAELGDDYRWSYKQAYEAGIFKNPDQAASLAQC